MTMRKLLEAMDQFAGQPEQVPGEQWQGTDSGTPGNKLVGESDKNKQQYTHDASCPYVTYGGDCECGKKTKTHSNDCAYRQGHDCDCAMSKNNRYDMDEAAEGNAPITSQDIISAWMQVFPNSNAETRRVFGNDHIVRLYLTKDKSECNSNIRENDPLHYVMVIEKDGSIREANLSMLVKPINPHMAYSSVKISKRTMKEPTAQKLLKRFQQIHDFVSTNAANMHNIKFDINEKLGKASTLGEDSASNKAFLDVEHLYRRDLAHLQDELETAGLVLGKDFWIKSDGSSWITYAAYDRQPLQILQKYNVGEYEDISETNKFLGAPHVREDEFDDFLNSMSDEEMYAYDQEDRHQGKSDKELGVKLRRGATIDDTVIDEGQEAQVQHGDIVQLIGQHKRPGYFRVDTQDAVGATQERPWIGSLDDGSGWYVGAESLRVIIFANDEDTEHFASDAEVDDYLDDRIYGYDHGENLDEAPELNNFDRNQALVRAPKDNAKQNIWMNYYQRAKNQMRKSDSEARHYADSMTRSDPGLNNPFKRDESIDLDESEESLAEAFKLALEDYVGNKYDPDTLYPKKAKTAAKDVKKVKAPKVADPKAVNESKSFQWSDYEHIPSMEDRLIIAETYFTKTTNLTESNDEPQREYFDTLTQMSDEPTSGNKYICTVLGLVNNKLLNLQHTEVITFVEKDEEGYKVKDKQGNVKTYPPLHKGNDMIISTFFFSNKESYNKFQTAVTIKFNHIFETASHETNSDEMRRRKLELSDAKRRKDEEDIDFLSREIRKLKGEMELRARDKKGSVTEAKSENRELWDRINSRGVVPSIDRERYTDLSGEGLEGPFRSKSGKVLYYDPKAGKYYDRDSDMYVDQGLEEAGPRDRLSKMMKDKELIKQAPMRPSPDKMQSLLTKLSDVQSKLAGLKDQKAVKEEAPIAPVAPATDPKVAQAQVNAANAIASAAKNQKPIPGAPQNASQQAPAPAGTATVAAVPGQQTPPTAGQPGGAPVAPKPGTPPAATGTAANTTTTPMQSLANSLSQLAKPGAGNKLDQAAKAIANIK